ncbi:MAG: ribonuclease P [Candidatus Thorarchaeota archaeon]|nr:MAG: ribonuclease P [Candidatus Thorarchaeota archaeon]
MKKGRRALREDQRRLARARIELLWQQAEAFARSDPARSQRRVKTARSLAQRARIKVPSHMKKRICAKCGTVLVPGRNCRVRMRGNRSRHLSVTCFECGSIRRFYARTQP